MDCCGQCTDAHRTAFKLFDDRQEQFPVHFVEAVGINFHPVKRIVGDLVRYPPIVINLGVITNTAQQPIDYSRRAARSLGDLACAFIIYFDSQDTGRALADNFQIIVWVKVQVENYSEPSA